MQIRFLSVSGVKSNETGTALPSRHITALCSSQATNLKSEKDSNKAFDLLGNTSNSSILFLKNQIK